MLAIKDFRWERSDTKTKADVVFGPLGTGQVDWNGVFDIIKSSDFGGPVSLHVEYTALKESTVTEKQRMMNVVRQDLAFLTQSLKTAGID